MLTGIPVSWRAMRLALADLKNTDAWRRTFPIRASGIKTGPQTVSRCARLGAGIRNEQYLLEKAGSSR